MCYLCNVKKNENMKKSSLLLVPAGGLANRMRAIVSAYSLCEKVGSSLSVVWFRDWALNAAFTDIFEPVDDSLFALREAGMLDFLINDRPRRRNLWIPKMFQRVTYQDRIYEQTVTPRKRIGFDFEAWAHDKKCYMSCYQEFGTFPNSLYGRIFRPVREVMDIVESNEREFGSHAVGMHIRRTDNAESIEKSPTHLFIKAAKDEIAMFPETKIYLATDSDSVKKEMRDALGSRLITSERTASRDSVSGIRDGLADMYTLSRTAVIYGSAGSSFSVMASLIGGNELKILEL